MSNNVKNTAQTFKKKYKLTSVDYHVLKNTASHMGYTVIEFNSITNDADIDTVINNLNLSKNILKARGFTYVSTDYRLIFINEGLNDEEKLLVLSHELGHIVCEHFSAAPIIGKDVKDEHEANEFSHYILHQSFPGKIKNFVTVHRKLFIMCVILLSFIIVSSTAISMMQNNNIYKDNLYITTTGEHYHKKDCIFVKNKTNIKKLTKEEFEKDNYSPCDMCLPNKN